eukprot:813010-Prymnesium_polylepis.3
MVPATVVVAGARTALQSATACVSLTTSARVTARATARATPASGVSNRVSMFLRCRASASAASCAVWNLAIALLEPRAHA